MVRPSLHRPEMYSAKQTQHAEITGQTSATVLESWHFCGANLRCSTFYYLSWSGPADSARWTDLFIYTAVYPHINLFTDVTENIRSCCNKKKKKMYILSCSHQRLITIRINLNTIFYTHVEHSPTKTIYIRYYMETHTHMRTHNDYSRNWVLILVGVQILWEEEGFQFGFKR